MDTKKMKELGTPKGEEKNKNKELGVDMEKVNKRNRKYFDDKKKIARNARQPLEIIKDTRFWDKGQIIRPSIAFADELIAQKTAKKITLEENEYIRNGKIVKSKHA